MKLQIHLISTNLEALTIIAKNVTNNSKKWNESSARYFGKEGEWKGKIRVMEVAH